MAARRATQRASKEPGAPGGRWALPSDNASTRRPTGASQSAVSTAAAQRQAQLQVCKQHWSCFELQFATAHLLCFCFGVFFPSGRLHIFCVRTVHADRMHSLFTVTNVYLLCTSASTAQCSSSECLLATAASQLVSITTTTGIALGAQTALVLLCVDLALTFSL